MKNACELTITHILEVALSMVEDMKWIKENTEYVSGYKRNVREHKKKYGRRYERNKREHELLKGIFSR